MHVRWNRTAERDYRKALLYIAEDSIAAAIAVRMRIDKKVESLKTHPAKYPPDRFRRINDGSIRAFNSNSLRITYRVFGNSIHIIPVRHVKRKPLQF